MNSFPQFELSRIVEKHSWRNILLNLIYEGKIDPWDIDIDVVIDEFMEKIKGMKELELHIPGNLILATSILLKYKSLYLLDNDEEIEDVKEEIDITTEPLNITKRIAPSRPITFNELITVIEKNIRIKINEIVKGRKSINREVLIELPKIKKEDISEKMEKIFSRLVELMDEYGTVRMEEIFEKNNRVENVSNFLIILHLENEDYLRISQKEIFGEVLLYINKERVVKSEG